MDIVRIMGRVPIWCTLPIMNIIDLKDIMMVPTIHRLTDRIAVVGVGMNRVNRHHRLKGRVIMVRFTSSMSITVRRGSCGCALRKDSGKRTTLSLHGIKRTNRVVMVVVTMGIMALRGML